VQGLVVARQTTVVGCSPPQLCVPVAAAVAADDDDDVRCLAGQSLGTLELIHYEHAPLQTWTSQRH